MGMYILEEARHLRYALRSVKRKRNRSMAHVSGLKWHRSWQDTHADHIYTGMKVGPQCLYRESRLFQGTCGEGLRRGEESG